MSSPTAIEVRLIGGPTAVLDLESTRFLTDPTFDGPTTYEDDGVPIVSQTGVPAASWEELQPVDVVLLSHDQHPDNLDGTGRAALEHAALVITTPDSAARIQAKAVVGLAPWQTHTLDNGLTVTAVPAQHGPDIDSESVSGQVTGFVVTGTDGRTLYVSGDNASVEVVRIIVARLGTPRISLLFTGAASVPFLFDGRFVTLTAAQAAEVGELLAPSTIVAVHAEGWSHYTDDREDLRGAFEARGIGDRLRLLDRGERVTVTDD